MVKNLVFALLFMIVLALVALGLKDLGHGFRPEMYYPIGIAGVALLMMLALSGPAIAANWRARGRSGILDPTQVEEMVLGSSPLILDIRDVAEFKGKVGHIRGALCMPYAEVPKRFKELQSKDPRPIIIVDTTDKRCYDVYDFLKKQGFDWLYVMKGGINAWQRDRLPLYH